MSATASDKSRAHGWDIQLGGPTDSQRSYTRAARYGEDGERYVALLLGALQEAEGIEVKRDRIACSSGFMAVEVARRSKAGEWRPTGICAEDCATWWVYVVADSALILRAESLRAKALEVYRQSKAGGYKDGRVKDAGDGKRTRIVRLTITEAVAAAGPYFSDSLKRQLPDLPTAQAA